MARVLLLTNSMGASAEVLPALGLLSHQVRVSPAEASALIDSPDFELLFVILEWYRLAGLWSLSRRP